MLYINLKRVVLMEAPICTSEDIRFDKEHVRYLIKKFIEDGVDAVQILADFDRTLTKEKIDEKMCSTCFIAIRKSPFVTSTYTEKSRENYECYRPIEMMPTCDPDDQEVSEGKITLEEKLKCMEEWWDKDLGALSKEGLY